jgi:hypothetical protein
MASPATSPLRFKNPSTCHFLEKGLGGLDGWQIIRCLGLIDTKGISQEVHTGLHVIVNRVTHFLSFARSVFFGALTVDILSLGLHHDQTWKWLYNQQKAVACERSAAKKRMFFLSKRVALFKKQTRRQGS